MSFKNGVQIDDYESILDGKWPKLRWWSKLWAELALRNEGVPSYLKSIKSRAVPGRRSRAVPGRRSSCLEHKFFVKLKFWQGAVFARCGPY